MRSMTYFTVVVLVIVMPGCLFPMSAALAQQPKNAPAGVQAMEKRIQELESTVKSLQTSLAFQYSNYASTLATLDCTNPGYQVIRDETVHVILFVACEDVSPYLEGYRVRLTIGNPYAVDFDGVKATLQYGKDMAESFKESTRVSVSSPERIRSGQWSFLHVNVTPAKAEDIRFMALEVKLNTVALRKPPR